MDTDSIINLAVAFLSGGAGWLTASYTGQNTFQKTLLERLSLVESKNEQQQRLLSQLQMQILEQEAEIESLRRQLEEKEQAVDFFTASYDHMPGPAWLKGVDGKMVIINRRYEDQWGVTKEKYIGSTDRDIWPEAIADRFFEHDREVISKKSHIVVDEKVPRKALEPISEGNQVTKWRIWKWPVFKGKELYGVGGLAIRYEELQQKWDNDLSLNG